MDQKSLMQRVAVPEVRFSWLIAFFLTTWWVWWLLGVEQFLPAIVLLGLAPFYLGNLRWQQLHLAVFAAVLVAAWWVIPVIRVERLDSFARTTVLRQSSAFRR